MYLIKKNTIARFWEIKYIKIVLANRSWTIILAEHCIAESHDDKVKIPTSSDRLEAESCIPNRIKYRYEKIGSIKNWMQKAKIEP